VRRVTIFPSDAPLWEKRLLVALLVVFALTAGMYSVVAPLFEGSDELLHFRVAHQLASGGPLPILDAENLGPWGSEAFQPPLYYSLAAALTFWIDTSDLGQVLVDNPHNEVRVLDGNLNILVHDWDAETLPWRWRGTILMGHLARLFSVALSAGSIYAAYRLGLELFPRERWLALAGAAAMAFTPMFAYVSGSVNNDNASVLLSTLSLWHMTRIIRRTHEGIYTRRMAAELGVLLGLAALAKVSTLGLFALAGLTMAYAAHRQRRWQTFFVDGPLIIGIAALIAGWWYWRNYRLYGDPLALNALLDVVSRRPGTTQPLLRLWAERRFTYMSYWGMFASASLPMADWTYDALNGLALLALAGLIVTLVRRGWRDGWQARTWIPSILMGLWVLVIGISVARYGNLHNTPEGRHAFPAIAVLNLGLVAGLGGSLPRRAGQVVVGVTLAFMAALTWAAPYTWILPQYRPPQPLVEEKLPAYAESDIVSFYQPENDEPAMRLLDYEVTPTSLEPGETLQVALTWQVASEMDRHWSIFVHVLDDDGIMVTQRDTYPGRGSLATGFLEEGLAWREEFLVPVPEGAYTPNHATIVLGLYDEITGTRMTLADGESNSAPLVGIDLKPPPNAEVPNPLNINFGDQMQLVGFALSERSVSPGETITLELYWQGLEPLSTDYTVFAHVLGADNHIWAGHDSWPDSGEAPTSVWEPGLVIIDRHELTLDPATPPGVYEVEIGAYWVGEEDALTRLDRFDGDGRVMGDFLLLTSLSVQPTE
jgi:4-amino-4-deoxy-L-arabinose transferase-like glycosyltransferase